MSTQDADKKKRRVSDDFPSTSWSTVQAAGKHPTPQSREALARLCSTYWYPLYAYIRRRGYGTDEAQDLTQEFFSRVLEKHYILEARRERGKFRAFLITALKHFLSNELDRRKAQKRGGGHPPIPMDFADAEVRYQGIHWGEDTPDRIVERQWAGTLFDRALARVREEFVERGKSEKFEGLKSFITGEQSRGDYGQVAVKLGMSEDALKVAVHRLRGRYREYLRAEIASTLADPKDIDSEIRYLLSILGS